MALYYDLYVINIIAFYYVNTLRMSLHAAMTNMLLTVMAFYCDRYVGHSGMP